MRPLLARSPIYSMYVSEARKYGFILKVAINWVDLLKRAVGLGLMNAARVSGFIGLISGWLQWNGMSIMTNHAHHFVVLRGMIGNLSKRKLIYQNFHYQNFQILQHLLLKPLLNPLHHIKSRPLPHHAPLVLAHLIIPISIKKSLCLPDASGS